MRRTLRTALLATVVATTSIGLVPGAAHAADPTGTIPLSTATESTQQATLYAVGGTSTDVIAYVGDGERQRVYSDSGTLRWESPPDSDVVGMVGNRIAYIDWSAEGCLHLVDLGAGTDTNVACGAEDSVLGPDSLIYATWSESDFTRKVYARTHAGATTLVSADADLDGFGYDWTAGPNGFTTRVGTYDETTETYSEGLAYRTFAAPATSTTLALSADEADGEWLSCDSVSATHAGCTVSSETTETEVGKLVPLTGAAATNAEPGIIVAGALQAWWLPTGGWRVKDAGGTGDYPDMEELSPAGDTFIGNAAGKAVRVTGRASSTVLAIDPGLAPLRGRDLALGVGRAAWTDNATVGQEVWNRTLTRSGSTLTAGPSTAVKQNATGYGLAVTSAWTISQEQSPTNYWQMRQILTRDGKSRVLNTSGEGWIRASGSRAVEGVESCSSLTTCTISGRVYDLNRTSERSIPLGWSHTVWGDYVAYSSGNGESTGVSLRDLSTGTVRVLQAPTANVDTHVAGIADGVVVWQTFDYETETNKVYSQAVTPGSTPVDLTASFPAGDIWINNVSSRGILFSRYNNTTDTEVWAMRTLTGGARSLPAVDGDNLQIVGDTLAWQDRTNGMPKVAPLAHVAHKPGFLGNLVAPTRFSGTSWKLQAQADAALTTCKIDILDATLTVVRSVNCLAANKALGEAAVTWNGKNTAGTLVPDGTYTWKLTAANADGNLQNTTYTGDANLTGTVTVGTATAPAAPTGAITVKLAGSSPVITWPAPPAGTTVVLRRSTGTTPPASATAGTEVYAGTGTSATDLVNINSTYSYSLFHQKDGLTSTEKLTKTFTAYLSPVASAPTRSYTGSNTLDFPVSWGEVDGAAAKYNVEYRAAGGAWTPWFTATTDNTARFGAAGAPVVPVAGTTYSFRVTTFDAYGNKSALSPVRNARVSRDERTGTFTGTWTQGSLAGRYLNTVSTNKIAGDSMTFTTTGTSVLIFGDKMPSGSSFEVYDGDTLIGTYNSYSSETQAKATLFSKTFATSATRTIKIVNLATAGRPNLRIDGFDYN